VNGFGFGKVFKSLFESTVNDTPLFVRWTWVALLTLPGDDSGVIDMTPEAIARYANLPPRQVRSAIEILTRPDPQSRSADEEGRRLVPIRESYGWRIVNFKHYRDLQRAEDRREYQRQLMRDRRAEEALARVSTREQSLALLADTETETETETSKPSGKKSRTKDATRFEETSIEYQLSTLLLDLIRRRDPKHKQPNMQGWCKDINFLIYRDGRNPEEIRHVIEWAQSDNFWCSNIRSTSKLREQFGTLVLKSASHATPVFQFVKPEVTHG
jgi:hypothetical protein